MKPYIYDATDIDPIEAFSRVKHMPYSLLLDSADRNHPNSRYSFVVCHPIETVEAKDGQVTITNWEQRLTMQGDPLEILQNRIQSWVEFSTRHPNMPPFQGGAAGLFSYDLGRYIEDLPSYAQNTSRTPDMAVGIYDQVLAHDHLLKKTYLFTYARNEEEAVRKREFLLGIYTKELQVPEYNKVKLDWEATFTANEYKDVLRKTIHYIHEGDIFQANIAQRFDAKLPADFDPYLHYLHLRKINPAPFSCFMNLGDVKISSASPERFMTVKDKRVETCPIKGTRPRSDKFSQDRANKNALVNSEKDKAENTMIVDLLRNDLSRVCDAHSIEVTDLCKLESFASVHHLVSTIKGMLPPDKTPIDLLRASFPGGSITGAPKIRAMEIIEEFEPQRRGAYCGAMGYIGFDECMDTNILIRTLTYENGMVSLQAGGGIVVGSDPEEEYKETWDKARAMFNSFDQEHIQLDLSLGET